MRAFVIKNLLSPPVQVDVLSRRLTRAEAQLRASSASVQDAAQRMAESTAERERRRQRELDAEKEHVRLAASQGQRAVEHTMQELASEALEGVARVCAGYTDRLAAVSAELVQGQQAAEDDRADTALVGSGGSGSGSSRGRGRDSDGVGGGSMGGAGQGGSSMTMLRALLSSPTHAPSKHSSGSGSDVRGYGLSALALGDGLSASKGVGVTGGAAGLFSQYPYRAGAAGAGAGGAGAARAGVHAFGPNQLSQHSQMHATASAAMMQFHAELQALETHAQVASSRSVLGIFQW